MPFSSAGRLAIAIAPDARLIRRVDVDAFAVALRNLIENALVHGAPEEPVTVALSGSSGVSVVNAGRVVPREELDRLTDRFKRGKTKSAGSGLGLAIASKLAGHMGGELRLNSPATGRRDGFEALLTL